MCKLLKNIYELNQHENNSIMVINNIQLVSIKRM